MISNTRVKILEYINVHRQARVYDLARILNITRASVHRQLNKLINEGVLEKIGKPPKVYYVLAHLNRHLHGVNVR